MAKATLTLEVEIEVNPDEIDNEDPKKPRSVFVSDFLEYVLENSVSDSNIIDLIEEFDGIRITNVGYNVKESGIDD